MIGRRLCTALLGGLGIAAGVFLHPLGIAAAFAGDGEIHGSRALEAILALRIACFVSGAALLLIAARIRRWTIPALAAAPILLLAAMAGWTYGLYAEWVRPPVRPLSEFCAWLKGPDVPFFGEGKLRAAEQELALPRSRPDQVAGEVKVRTDLADYLLRVGRIEEALQVLEEGLRAATKEGLPAATVNRLRKLIGIAHLRSGELRHCVKAGGADRCLFPISAGGVWADPEPARLAADQFTRILETEPDDAGVKWLLNIAHMTAGTWPDGVPPAFLIPPETFASSATSPRFRDVAPALGVGPVGLAGGVILEDFDRDGFTDIVTAGNQPCSTLHYFHNDGDGTFSDRSEASGLASQPGGFNLNQTDYNNDGLLDIYVIRGAWLQAWGRLRNSLLRQNPDGTFTDVTDASGLGDVAYPNITAEWADLDGDGDLDLFVGGEILAAGRFSPSQLYRNNGDGTFTDIARAAGVVNRRSVKGVSWGDIDNDGDPDLYVSNLGQPNRLYLNGGDGTFSDVGAERGVAEIPPRNLTFGAWFFDVDNDGWLDLFVAGYPVVKAVGTIPVSLVAADYLGQRAEVETLHVFLNDRTGHFHDASHEMGIDRVRAPMGGNFGDVDNDGYTDFYLGTGGPAFELLVPNVLYRNMEGKRFADITTAAGVGHLQKGHGVAFGDVDNDGDLDLYCQLGGMYPADVFGSVLFENLGTPNHWLTVRLVGTRANRPGIGARLRLTIDDGGRPRDIHVVAGSGGSFGASTLQQEIGIGAAQGVRELEILWPGSGLRQVFHDLPADRFVEITEGVDEIRVETRRRVALAPLPASR